MKYLFAKSFEYEDYCLRSDKKNKIFKFWVKILEGMPDGTRSEANKKYTNLIFRGSEGKYKVTGVKPFQFITKDGSEELQRYLSEFAIFVEHDSEEIFKWKEDVHQLLITKGIITESQAAKLK